MLYFLFCCYCHWLFTFVRALILFAFVRAVIFILPLLSLAVTLQHLHRSSTPADTTMDSVPPAVPHSVPPAPSAQPFERLFSQSAISTPGRTDTEESIKNSPFQSPFYRGKTSYGGASALPQPKAKRQRTELTSAVCCVCLRCQNLAVVWGIKENVTHQMCLVVAIQMGSKKKETDAHDSATIDCVWY